MKADPGRDARVTSQHTFSQINVITRVSPLGGDNFAFANSISFLQKKKRMQENEAQHIKPC